jgi:hypothetical protein
MKIVSPLAIRASLLMTLSLKMATLSKNYEFSVNLIEYILINIPGMIEASTQELNFKTQFVKDEVEPSNDYDKKSSLRKAFFYVLFY